MSQRSHRWDEPPPDPFLDEPPPDYIAAPQGNESELDEPRFTFRSGGSFILDTPPEPVSVWGRGDDVLWAEGEALIIAAPQGLGKTTIGQQLALGRCGIPEYAQLFGFPIAPGQSKVLYLAMDRPRQAARSFRRMVGEAHRSELDDRLLIWPGPPPSDVAKHPGLLTTLCLEAGADTVVVDSIKDAAIGLTDDEVGAAYNRARQLAIAKGVEVLELHHLRKAPQGGRKGAGGIDDIYGSTWITSGAGSVLYLSGDAGDPVVGLQHLKQPMSEVGPMQVIHDANTGRSTIFESANLATLASAHPDGLSATEAAAALFDVEKPTPAQKEKARRKLERLVTDGALVVITEGNQRAGTPRRWGHR